MTVKVKIDLSGMEKRFSHANFIRTRKLLGEQILADSTPFVPKDEGFLRSSGDIAPDGSKVIWDEPYAKAQFYGRVGKSGAPVRKYTTAGTGKRWDLKAKAIHGSSWQNLVKKGLAK